MMPAIQLSSSATWFSLSQVELESCFQLDRFDSLLLPQNNRPLEPSVLLALKELFNRSNANMTALHMLSVDCQVAAGIQTSAKCLNVSLSSKAWVLQVARITGVTEEQKTMMGVESGLELVTLPHGRQLRQDLLERCKQRAPWGLLRLGVISARRYTPVKVMN